MTLRTRRRTVTFCSPFVLAAAERSLPAGTYEVVTDEELIEGLSFPVYRRVATTMLVPAANSSSSVEMLTIDAHDLTGALERDAVAGAGDAPPASARSSGSQNGLGPKRPAP